jgi:para-nitrobenzyl esterase
MRSLVLISLAALVACSNHDAAAPDGAVDTAPDAYACATPAPGPAAERVPTTTGMIHGAMVGATYAYLGISYAAPPTGTSRFAPPATPACPSDEVAATAIGPECPQLADDGTFGGSEDCLHLNVWAPAAAAAPRAVMVFVHGGGNVSGSASQALYAGDKLATAGDVIVVTFDYRLGQLGFIDHSSLAVENNAAGNYGLLDQIAALQWVHTNIAAFGGDPANVTVFGESAGGRDTCSLVAAPGAAGLFAHAIVESGSCRGLPTRAAAEITGEQFVTAAGCAGNGDVPGCLRALTAEQVIRANAASASILEATPYQPEIDGTIQPVEPEAALAAGTHNHVAFMVGANADETGQAVPAVPTEAAYEQLVTTQFGALGSQVLAHYPAANFPTPRAAYVRVTTDSRFVCPSRDIARAASHVQTEPVYRYFFQYPATPFGATHGIELPFVFGTFDSILVNGTPYTPTPAELALSAAIQTDWTTFAKTGVPAGTPTWPVYAAATDPTRTFAAMVGETDGIRTADCDFWDNLH